MRRCVITAIDVRSDFAFAFGYSNLSSASASDFFEKLEKVSPFRITHVQTDNGTD